MLLRVAKLFEMRSIKLNFLKEWVISLCLLYCGKGSEAYDLLLGKQVASLTDGWL